MSTKLNQLIARYLEIEEQYLKVNAEVDSLKAAIKDEMKDQGIKKNNTFEVTTYTKNTIKTSLLSFAKLISKKRLDGEIVLDKKLQEVLGSRLLEQLTVIIDSQEITSIKRNWK